jgi:hypothetical protein
VSVVLYFSVFICVQYDYYTYRSISVSWASVPDAASNAGGPQKQASYFGAATFSTRPVLAAVQGASSPTVLALYIAQHQMSIAPGVNDR